MEAITPLLVAFTGVSRYPLPPLGRFVGSPFADASASSSTAHPVRLLLLTTVLRPVNRSSDVRPGSADLDGTHYGDSIVFRCSMFCTQLKGIVEYDIGRRFRVFERSSASLMTQSSPASSGIPRSYSIGVAPSQVCGSHGAPQRIRHDVSTMLRPSLLGATRRYSSDARTVEVVRELLAVR